MIGAIVLAAGLSRRMGQQKLVLPWGDTTVIGQVVRTLIQAEIKEIIVVTGGAHSQLENALKEYPLQLIFNPRYEEDQMILSLQVGLAVLSGRVEAALLALGDQPQIELETVQAVLAGYRESQGGLVVPSFRMRRGHPIVIGRPYWSSLMTLQPPATLREFLNLHSNEIHYINVERDTILQDLDTPEDYQRETKNRLP